MVMRSLSFGSLFETQQQFDDSCLKFVQLSTPDRVIFWIGGTIIVIASLFFLRGYTQFKALRKQPGDLILGMVLSEVLLAANWLVIAAWPKLVDDEYSCTILGSAAIAANILNNLYNAGFSIFLIISLRNALKRDKIPRRGFHIIIILLVGSIMGFLFYQNDFGKNLSATCSIKYHCDMALYNYRTIFVMVSYTLLGTYTFHYIKKNTPKGQNVKAKRIQFLIYYQRYILAAIVITATILFANLINTVLNQLQTNNPENLQFGLWSSLASSFYNISKLCEPLVLLAIRYRDPLIRRKIAKAISTWKKKQSEKPIKQGLLSGDNTADIEQAIKMRAGSEMSHLSENEFIFNKLSDNRKVEITYTLLSSLLYANHVQSQPDDQNKKPYQHVKLIPIEDDLIKSDLPPVKEELERQKFHVLKGVLKSYSPEIFMKFIEEDKDYLDISESLDFVLNRDQIAAASSPGGRKSGEFFFFSRDKKLIIKTVPDLEIKMLRGILEKYQKHFEEYPNSLIAKIYGAFTFFDSKSGQIFNLVIMKNICGFPARYITRTYDTKGSKYSRQVIKTEGVIEEHVLRQGVMKDLDFERFEKRLFIRDAKKSPLLQQIEADSLFLRRMKLIDYSLMIFLVNKDQYRREHGNLEDEFITKNHLASLENTRDPGFFYNVGIVDYLQPYNFQKAFEKVMKKVKKLNFRLDTSSQEPVFYSERFLDFVQKIVEPEVEV